MTGIAVAITDANMLVFTLCLIAAIIFPPLLIWSIRYGDRAQQREAGLAMEEQARFHAENSRAARAGTKKAFDDLIEEMKSCPGCCAGHSDIDTSVS